MSKKHLSSHLTKNTFIIIMMQFDVIAFKCVIYVEVKICTRSPKNHLVSLGAEHISVEYWFYIVSDLQ